MAESFQLLKRDGTWRPTLAKVVTSFHPQDIPMEFSTRLFSVFMDFDDSPTVSGLFETFSLDFIQGLSDKWLLSLLKTKAWVPASNELDRRVHEDGENNR
jgi:hypothetical protein